MFNYFNSIINTLGLGSYQSSDTAPLKKNTVDLEMEQKTSETAQKALILKDLDSLIPLAKEVSPSLLRQRIQDLSQKLVSHKDLRKKLELFSDNHAKCSLEMKGKQIIDTPYHLGDAFMGLAKLERVATIDKSMEIYVEKWFQAEDKKDKEKILKNIEKLCDKFNHDFKNRTKKTDWVDSYFFRYIAGDQKKIDISAKKSWFSKFFTYFLKEPVPSPYANETYHQIMEKYYVGGIPINLRYQSFIEETGEKWGFIRCGVISDLSNGFTNLHELKELAKNPAKIVEKQEELKKITPVSRRVKESLAYALEEIQHPETTLIKRREYLQDQMLILVAEHLNRHKDEVIEAEDKDVFAVMQVCLLNEKTRKVDSSSGWAHYENNAILDMAEIFKEFKGKQIFFDVKAVAPSFDSDGNIIMPLVSQSQKASQLTLNLIFFNNSPQGHTKNTGEQARLNELGLIQLRQHLAYLLDKKVKTLTTKFKEQEPSITAEKLAENLAQNLQVQKLKNISKNLQKFDQELKKGNSSYTTAEYITEVAREYKIPLALSCASAKDRTGIVAARAIWHCLCRSLDKISSVSTKTKEAFKKQKADEIFLTDQFTAQVAEDNTGSTALKGHVRAHIPGVSWKTRILQVWDMIFSSDTKL